MSSHEQTCYTCWTTFYTSHPFITTCPTCRQTQEITRSHERQMEAQREQAESARREQEYYARQQLAAEQARVDAINRQTRAIFESSIDPAIAYNTGRAYLANDYPYKNSLNLKLTIHEDGLIWYSWDKNYITPHLQDQMDRGLCDTLPSTNNVMISLENSAYIAGYQNAMGTLGTYFTLHTGCDLQGKNIPSEAFNSYMKSIIDSKTGYISFTWNHPFKNDKLNDRFHAGANKAAEELNTEEWKKHRLKVVIPESKRFNRRKFRARVWNKLLPITGISFLIFLFFKVMTSDDGFLTKMLYNMLIGGLWVVLKAIYEYWQSKNEDYIYDQQVEYGKLSQSIT